MKICGLIAEYNPFHLGHLKQIEYIKNTLNAQKIVVIMSGNFTQRGEVAVLDKFTRAKHAIIAGADMVIELPTVFAISNAEIFARGAVSILHSLGVVDGICFGVESGSKQEYLDLAKAMLNESKQFKKALKEQLDRGVSLAKAKFEAVKSLGGTFNEQLISSPNNVLALEYTKAVLRLNSNIDVFPMLREGTHSHNDLTLHKGLTSATSIREVIKTGKLSPLKKCMPRYVFDDLKKYPFTFQTLVTYSAIKADASDLASILDCTEGLENRIKAFCKDNHDLQTLVEKISTKRYTKTRIQRILLANLLSVNLPLVKDCLESSLYAKVLAIDSQSKDLITEVCKNSAIPILTRKSDTGALKKTALKCFEKDVLATDLYSLMTGDKLNEHHMLIV